MVCSSGRCADTVATQPYCWISRASPFDVNKSYVYEVPGHPVHVTFPRHESAHFTERLWGLFDVSRRQGIRRRILPCILLFSVALPHYLTHWNKVMTLNLDRDPGPHSPQGPRGISTIMATLITVQIRSGSQSVMHLLLQLFGAQWSGQSNMA